MASEARSVLARELVKALPWVILGVIGILLVRQFFPRTVEISTPPIIRTVRDTVRTLDTAWVVKLRTKTDTLYRERITVTLPETVYVAPRLWGLTALNVAPQRGDTTVAQGFSIEPGDSGQLLTMDWRVQWWTPGPLRGLTILPNDVRAQWGEPPKPGCGFLCAVKKYAIGAGAGWALCKL